MNQLRNNFGFTLIELITIIVLIGVLATVALRKISPGIETAKAEQTKTELGQLAYAIAGNPGVLSKGARSDFGYVGDVGSLPPSLNALLQNPGGFATWNGPYIGSSFASDEALKDGWGSSYVYSGTMISSTGSGSNIDKLFANSSAELLSNSVSGYVVDAGGIVPGPIYKDSLLIQLIYPDGAGNLTTTGTYPTDKGNFSYTGIPIGNHILRAIYLPDSDTTSYAVSVDANSTVKLYLTFPADLW